MVSEELSHFDFYGFDDGVRSIDGCCAGGDSDIYLAGTGKDSDCWVGRFGDEMADLVINSTFTQIGHFEDAVVDGLAEVVFLAEVGDDLVGDKPLHLEGHTRETDDCAFLGFDHEGGRSAVGVSDHLGSSRYLGLTLVVFGEYEAPVLEPFTEFSERVSVGDYIDAEDVSDCFTCQIVLGRSDAAAGNYDIGATKRDAQDLGHAVLVVADARLVEDVGTVFGEALGNPSRVGVDDLAQEEFGAD